MFNSVEYVRSVCKQRNIPISKLEKDCGCGNGYLNPKKLKFIPYERAVIIADYLGLSIEYLMTGENKETPPTPEGEGRLSKEDAELFELIRSLPEDFRKREIAYLREYVNRSNTSSAHQEEEP